jgi:hypothetical protein
MARSWVGLGFLKIGSLFAAVMSSDDHQAARAAEAYNMLSLISQIFQRQKGAGRYHGLTFLTLKVSLIALFWRKSSRATKVVMCPDMGLISVWTCLLM